MFFKLRAPLFALVVLAVAGAAQNSLPAVTETAAVTDLKTLLPAGENPKPLLVNFWATWCGPCRAEFPELVKLDREYRAKGLDFVLVSVDDAALIETRVPEFLRAYDATMPSYLLALPDRARQAKAVRQIFPRFPDSYPLTLLFDGKGRLVYQKLGVVDPQILRARIDRILNNKTPAR